MLTHMASTISVPIHFCCTSYMQSNTLTSPVVICPKIPTLKFSTLVSQLGYSPWNGLRHVGISISPKFLALERKKRSKGKVVYASLFGVGAPEALVIGVVALLVFGPKGLAEVARNLGKTLREFQPTIRELQDVSREFKSTLEREIGLDDIPSSPQNTYSTDVRNTGATPSSVAAKDNTQAVADSNGAPLANTECASEELLKITEEQIKSATTQQQDPLETTAYSSEELLKVTEEQLKAAASQQQPQTPPPSKDTTSP